MIITPSRALALAAALWAALPVPTLAALPAEPCPASAEVLGTPELPHVTAALRGGKALDVLAVGSATMFGPEASLAPGTVTSQIVGRSSSDAQPQPSTPSTRAFPLQMAKQIQQAMPGLAVNLTVRGGRGLLATEMLALLRQELSAHHYDLVIWQTGTVEAVRNLSPAEFGQTLSEGAEATADAGSDLILVDPQYSRFLQTNSNLEPYFQALQQAALLPGVALFRRFDIMRGWANEGGLDLERTARGDREKAIEVLHACLGRTLARLVMAASRG